MEGQLLFYTANRNLRDWLAERGQAASVAIEQMDPDYVLSLPRPDLVDELFRRFMLDDPVADLEGRYTPGARDTKIDVTGDFMYGQRFDGGPTFTPGTEVSVHIPVQGPSQAFELAASSRTSNALRGRLSRGELILSFQIPSHKLQSDQELAGFKEQVDRTVGRVAEHVARALADIQGFNTKLRVDLEAGIERRKDKVLADRNLDAFLGIPMTPRMNPPIVAVPVQKRRSLHSTSGRSGKVTPYAPEPALTSQQIEEVIRAITKWSEGPERLPETFSSMGEEALRDSLLIVLNGMFDWAGSEVFRRKGKTDITVLISGTEQGHGVAFVAELKFWKGRATLPQALNQLLGYTLWRDSVCALVLLIRNKGATAVIAQAGGVLADDPRCKRELEPVAAQRAFAFTHPVDESKELRVVLIPVVIATGQAVATEIHGTST